MSEYPMLTVGEVKAKKKALTKDILRLITNFQNETGLIVTGINLQIEEFYNYDCVTLDRKEITKFSIETELI